MTTTVPRKDTLSPEEFVAEIESALPRSSPKEARRLIAHARAWAITRYAGVVPGELEVKLELLGDKCHS